MYGFSYLCGFDYKYFSIIIVCVCYAKEIADLSGCSSMETLLHRIEPHVSQWHRHVHENAQSAYAICGGTASPLCAECESPLV